MKSKKKKLKKRHLVWGALAAGLLTVFVNVGLWIYAVYFQVGYEQFFPDPQAVLIPDGSSVGSIATLLERKGLLRNPSVFVFYVKIKDLDKRLHAGLFDLQANMTIAELVKTLSEKTGKYAQVTIPEGSSLRQIAAILAEKKLVSKEEFLKFTKNGGAYFQHQFPFLEASPTQNLEGYLFPETYFFSYGVSIPVIVEAFLKQTAGLYLLWENATSTVKLKYSFHETLTMASLIEKEAENPEEMPIIAGVFYNRINKNMTLSSDPTVIYALGQDSKAVVTYRDLKVDSPYNTYKYKLLPPTPIASPGKKAFLAALKPAQVPYLFFVADHQGNHIFTTTYQAHISAQNSLPNRD